jgi:transposase
MVCMRLSSADFKKIEGLLPVQRGNVKHGNLKFLNAILYMAENGCKWRSLPREFGNWNSIYMKANRWSKQGVLDRVFAALQKEQIIQIRIEHVSIDSTSIKLHPDAHGALKKTGSRPSGSQKAAGTQSFMWLPRMIRLQ